MKSNYSLSDKLDTDVYNTKNLGQKSSTNCCLCLFGKLEGKQLMLEW